MNCAIYQSISDDASVRNKMIEQKSQQAAPLNLFNGDNQKNGTFMPNADVRETKDDAGDDPIE